MKHYVISPGVKIDISEDVENPHFLPHTASRKIVFEDSDVVIDPVTAYHDNIPEEDLDRLTELALRGYIIFHCTNEEEEYYLMAKYVDVRILS